MNQVKILREHRDGGSIEAIRSGIKFILTSVVPRRCDSDGVSDCVRCQSVYLARAFQSVIDELSEPTTEAAENPPAPPETTNSPTKPNEPACTECSRLASRVEELEKVLGDLVKAAGHTHRCDFKACSCGRVEGFKVALGEATRLLAGAHAEEKSK